MIAAIVYISNLIALSPDVMYGSLSISTDQCVLLFFYSDNNLYRSIGTPILFRYTFLQINTVFL